MFRRNQSTQAAAMPQKQPIQAYQMQDGGIHPATTADVGAQGKALDTDDLVIFLITFGAVWTVAVIAYSLNRGWALGLSVIVWTAGGLVLGVLLLFIQSRTWVQTWNGTLHSSNERLRIRAQERVLTYMAECDVEKERIREEARVQIAEITERMRIEAQGEIVRQVEEHSQPQSTMNQLANYVAPAEDAPYYDELRDRLLRYLVGLYDEGIGDDGRIVGRVLWSARGDLNERDQKRVLEMFSDAGRILGSPVVYQAENKHWYINVNKLATPGLLVRVFDRIHTGV